MTNNCRTCGLSKPIDEFRLTRAGKVSSKCLECYRVAKALWDAKYRAANATDISVKKAEYRKSRPELQREQGRRYRAANPDKVRASKAAWVAKNRHTRIKYNHGYRARARGVESLEVSKSEILRIYRSPCFYCGAVENITLDHAIPLSRGGRHAIGNLVPACLSCNVAKRDSLLIEWRYDQIRKAIRIKDLNPGVWAVVIGGQNPTSSHLVPPRPDELPRLRFTSSEVRVSNTDEDEVTNGGLK